MSLVTVKELVDSCDNIWENNWLWFDKEGINEFVRAIQHIIKTEVLVQHYWKEILDTPWSISLPDSTKVKVGTLLRINEEIEQFGAEDNVYANFAEFLENDDEKEMFGILVDIYDSFDWDEIVKQIKRAKLFDKVPKESPLYRLLEIFMEKKDMITSIMEVFKENWIDIVNNPIVQLPIEAEQFINLFKNHILSLINKWNWNSSYIHQSSSTLN